MSVTPGCKIGIVGCGVVGAAIAYELSRVPGLDITVLDQRSPEVWQASGAALGVLMAAIAQKLQGSHVQLRLASLQRYETLIPELEALLGRTIPYNRQGILQLYFDPLELPRWQTLQAKRQQQGFQLQLLSPEQVMEQYPELQQPRLLATGQPLAGAIYSPQDRQLDPIILTQALIQAAQHQGVDFRFQTPVQAFSDHASGSTQVVTHLHTATDSLPLDWLVLAAGLGTPALTACLQQPMPIRPVLGQALHLRRPHPLKPNRPVIHGGEVHLVPLNATDLWVGATVEFSPDDPNTPLQPDPRHLEVLQQQAIALYPELAAATILRSWSGLRPRPEGRSAPILGPLVGYSNVLLATGHYRNGVLLAPITAVKIREWITQGLS